MRVATVQLVFTTLLYLVAFCPVRGAPHTDDNKRWNTNFNKGEDPTKFYGEWPDHQYFPSPDDWRSLPVYQLITDRFADGDPTNSEGWPWYGGFDVRDHAMRHGGDFRGIAQHLDYIRGLGVMAVWISPIFQNGFNSYHQYAQRDFTLIDRRLGTLDDLRELTSAAHARGMYILIDMVVNHMDDCYHFEGGDDYKIHTGESHLKLSGCKPDEPGGFAYRDFHHNNTWDPEGKYTGENEYYYDSRGNKYSDTGKGTYSKSDFHHNGKLRNFDDPFQINVAKLYGLMDDLRTEGESVRQKHIAMTKALIKSADVDGFRVDTPMQVDLGFFKEWIPATKDYAASLGKKNFGIWGEFFVRIGRYATMTGKGKDNSMYGTTEFIDDVPTFNGGIEYQYWGYMIWKYFRAGSEIYTFPLTHTEKFDADGTKLLYNAAKKKLDHFNPQTGRQENTMWHFCNNHDQWRMAALDNGQGEPQFRSCLVWMSFWPGVPLHYAGDEQLFKTPGTALDGWAREELALSHAWRAMNLSLPQKDNFDMAHPFYRYIQQMNRIRRSLFDKVFSCDEPFGYQTPTGDVFSWYRGCSSGGSKSDDPLSMANTSGAVMIIVNFGNKAFKWNRVKTPWPAFENGLRTKVVDAMKYQDCGHSAADQAHNVIGDVDNDGFISGVVLEPYGAMVLTTYRDHTVVLHDIGKEPVVCKATPSHDAVIQNGLKMSFRFDFYPEVSWACRNSPEVTCKHVRVMLDDTQLEMTQSGLPSAAEAAEGLRYHALEGTHDAASILPGFHSLRVIMTPQSGNDVTLFASRFRKADDSKPLSADVTMEPVGGSSNPELVSVDLKALHHSAVGATYWRARNSDDLQWQDWTPMPTPDNWSPASGAPRISPWESKANIPTIVQYFCPGSASYFTGGCRTEGGTPCKPSMHSVMYMRVGEWSSPGNPFQMKLVDDYTWHGEVPVGSGGAEIWFVPHRDEGNGKMGWMMESPIQRNMEKSGLWQGVGEVSILSSWEYSKPLKVTPCCRLQATDESGPSEPAHCSNMGEKTCLLAFNDLSLSIQALNPEEITGASFWQSGTFWLGVVLVILAVFAFLVFRSSDGSLPQSTSRQVLVSDENPATELAAVKP